MGSELHPLDLETDPRFPSGPWTGFFLQKAIPGRHLMELRLQFAGGTMHGEGRDWVGAFTIQGHYALADGTCSWIKQYLGKHSVSYRGFNEGKGIWGTWEMYEQTNPLYQRGGFHIWPEGMPDPTAPHADEEAEAPVFVDLPIEELEEVPVGPRTAPDFDRRTIDGADSRHARAGG